MGCKGRRVGPLLLLPLVASLLIRKIHMPQPRGTSAPPPMSETSAPPPMIGGSNAQADAAATASAPAAVVVAAGLSKYKCGFLGLHPCRVGTPLPTRVGPCGCGAAGLVQGPDIGAFGPMPGPKWFPIWWFVIAWRPSTFDWARRGLRHPLRDLRARPGALPRRIPEAEIGAHVPGRARTSVQECAFQDKSPPRLTTLRAAASARRQPSASSLKEAGARAPPIFGRWCPPSGSIRWKRIGPSLLRCLLTVSPGP
jgi:hypothetical protein